MRQIDAEWLISLYKPYENYKGREWGTSIGTILANIDDAPSIDIVKCGDCKYDHQCNHSVQRITSKPDYMSVVYVPIGWCERGERRE